ncbi:MAG: hypothetical protein CSA11_00515 [Chloroflexi bacterium]|nr:MAG: hypothetical protein CSA11_00515 [Chloroflexota bacterium]
MGNMTQTEAPPTIIYAEQEHASLRAVVVLAMLTSYIFCFWLIHSLGQSLPERLSSLAFVIACLLAAPLAAGITWLLERWMKHIWHSGYDLTLYDNSFQVSQPKTEDMNFNFEGHFSNLNWYFTLTGYKRGGRERRVSNKWLCLCSQIQQDEHRVIIYAFASPQKTAVYQKDHPLQFEKLHPVEVYASHKRSRFDPPSRPGKLPTEIISGKNGRYWLAEQRRWTEGLELTFKDYETFLNYLQTHSLN